MQNKINIKSTFFHQSQPIFVLNRFEHFYFVQECVIKYFELIFRSQDWFERPQWVVRLQHFKVIIRNGIKI
jgi:hypothetical protein